ncbi:hypothetical protein PN36_00150 [Candidatus Thiomargarita nelsonii]|uniref:Uncharacterized protein n=1 Tax=Candidatus Thiomargarita nelsonii TaxID=1003181 RepID=A0A0A6PM43_9GAMM|nr:hypothetical protein PN36_00150 [Candidatus Thiomargarita nelsonii]
MNLAVTLILIFLSGNSYGFDLFDPDRGKPPPAPVVQKPPKTLPVPFRQSTKPPSRPTRSKTASKKPQKDFTLQGTSRIGDKRVAILKGPDNKEFLQRFKNNRRTAIEGYEGYYLLSVKGREIQIEYPEDAPCRTSNEKKGVKCDDGEMFAILTLTQGRALPPSRPSVRQKPPKGGENARKGGNQRKTKFNRKVIEEHEVPPGMRVVHTPFGDRLVPIK